MRAWLPLLVAFLLLLGSPVQATHSAGSGPRSLGGATVPPQPALVHLEAEAFDDLSNGSRVNDPEARGGTAWKLSKYGAISTTVSIPSTGVVWVDVRARGEHPPDMLNTHMHPLIDGLQRGEWDLTGDDWKVYRQSIPVLAGERELGLDNFNNYHAAALDRTLLIDWVTVSQPTLDGAPRVGAGTTVVDAPDVHAAGTGRAEENPDARDGTQWLMWGVGCFVEAIVLEGDGTFEATPRLKGNEREGGGSHVIVRLDGAKLDEYLAGDDWIERTTRFDATHGAHVLEICYDNDYGGDLKRNLVMDDLTLRGVEVSPPSLPGPVEAQPWRTAHGGLSNHRAAPSALGPSATTLTKAWRFDARGSVTGTPVHDEGIVYFGDWGGGVHALRLADGTVAWSLDHGAGIDSSLALDDARVFVADMRGALSARDRATGDLLWSRPMDVPGTHLYGSPVVTKRCVLLGVASQQTDITYSGEQDFRGSVACVEASTGKLVWQTYMPPPGGRGVSVWSTPAVDEARGLLFVGTGNAYGAPAGDRSDAIVALRLSDGSVAWTFQATQNDTFDARGSPGPDYDFGSSPLLVEAGGRALVVDGDKGGRYYALDRDTGELAWRTKVDFIAPNATLAQKEGFIGTAAFSDGTIFAPTSSRSMVHALDAASGEVRWATELNPPPRQYGDRMFGSTTVSGGIVLQGNAAGDLTLLDAKDGRILARVPVGGQVQGGVSLAGDLVIVPDAGDELWDVRGAVTAFRVLAKAAPPEEKASVEPPAQPPTGGPMALDPKEGARVLAWPAWLVVAGLVAAAAAWRRR